MDEFTIKNAERVPFRDMCEAKQIAILKAKLNAPESVEVCTSYGWTSAGKWAGVRFNDAYRVRAIATPLNIPWEAIALAWQWAAMDADKRIYFYTNEPDCQSVGWDGESLVAIAEILNIPTIGIDWRRSKTRRPV